ncbi:divalent metal cation transporter [candidate division KSB1 bacterium]|nr:divalent metal cation transporter [candidate division KSB1 bacterium]
MITFIRKVKSSIGPGWIIAAACLGPGSITTSSKIGAEFGYEFLWVIVAASLGMGIFMTMAARYGVSNSDSLLQSISIEYGRWFAAIIGISAFMTSMSFQFGNNLGGATALEAITGINDTTWPLVITPVGLILIFFAKSLYKVVEKLMIVLAMMMVLAFITNLFFTKPDLAGIPLGFLPNSIPENAFSEMIALVGTTFVLHACLYQAYLVQDKGWKLADLKKGSSDSLVGIIILGGVSAIVIITAGAALHPFGITIKSAADMAIQLEALFGPYAKYIFSVGLFAAAFSSLLVSAMIGGSLISDGLGLGRSLRQNGPRIFATIIMLVGMCIAVFFRGDVVYAIVLAQASSMLAVPTIAIGMILILNNKKVMGDLRNNLWHNILAVFGIVLILVMVYNLYQKIITFLKVTS